MMKRAAALVLAVSMMAATFTGCGNKEFDGTEVVAKVGETEVTADVANFFARYQQGYYETYYADTMGEEMWAENIGEGLSYEEAVKSEVLEALKTLYVVNEYADEYNVSLTKEEKNAIKKAAESFVKANDEDDLALVSGNEEVVTEVLEKITIQHKMRKHMIKDVDRIVSNDEAAQKRAQYVYFSFVETDEEDKIRDLDESEKEQLINKAEALIEGGKKTDDFAAYAKEKGYDVSALTFDSETTAPSAVLVEAADSLKEGEFADVVVDKAGCYVVKLVSSLDKDATNAKKEQIILEREDAEYRETCEKWTEEIGVELNEDVWEKIGFQKVGVTMKTSTTEEKTEE